jgi:hypothetical protein
MVSIFSNDHLPWLNGARLCITLPRTLNLSELPRHVYLQDGFNKLVAFADAVNNLSLESTSPYPVEARALIRYANMHQILSDIKTAQGSIFKANPKLHSLCRLAILLYIHAVSSTTVISPRVSEKKSWCSETGSLSDCWIVSPRLKVLWPWYSATSNCHQIEDRTRPR